MHHGLTTLVEARKAPIELRILGPIGSLLSLARLPVYRQPAVTIPVELLDHSAS